MDRLHEQIELMRAARVLVNMSQTDLAVAVGVSRQKIVRMENGSGNVPVGIIVAVRDALEKAGVIFLPSEQGRGPGICRKRLASQPHQSNNDAVNPSEEAACSEPSQNSTSSSEMEIPSYPWRTP